MFNRRLFTILSIVFVQIAGAALILPILPLFAERQFNLHPASISLLVSSFFIAQFFAAPILGQLSDRFGRVPILILSQLGSAASFFIMAAAGTAWLLFAARIVDGITGGNIIIAQAYVTDITPQEKRTEAFGYIFAAFGIGFIIGPALGGLLSAWYGPQFPFIVAGVASVLTAIACLFLEETVHTGKTVKGTTGSPGQEPHPTYSIRQRALRLKPADVLHNPSLMLILTVGFIAQFGMGMVQATFALYAAAVLFRGAEANATNLGIGLLLAAVGFGQFITQTWLIRPLKKRIGDARLVIVGTVLRAIAMAIFAIARSPMVAVIGSLLFAIGTGLTMPPLQTLATRTVDEKLRGGVLGVFQSSLSLAIIFSTAIAGLIFSVGPTLPYWAGAVLSLVAIPPALGVLRRVRQESLAQSSSPSLAD